MHNNLATIKRTSLKGIVVFLLSLMLLQCVIVQPVAAASVLQQTSDGRGLAVSNALINVELKPGEVYVHPLQIGSGSKAAPMDITIIAAGFGQYNDGGFYALEDSNDTSPYSARSYITSISQTSFHLDPGSVVPVDVTITAPADMGSDPHYAVIYISTEPVDAGNGVGTRLANIVPVVITPKEGAQLVRTGKITNFTIDTIEAGKPIQSLVTVQNTGNRYFKVQGSITIIDASGNEVALLSLSPTSNSIFPTFSQDLAANYSALDQSQGLAAGIYKAKAEITSLDDNSLVDSAETEFEISEAYRPFPEIPEENIQITCFKGEEPTKVDATAKTDTEITFEGVGIITGCVAIGKYTQDPSLTPKMSDDPGNGGMGRTPIKYIGIQTDGFTQGTAHISIHYKTNELNDIQENSLFLASYSNKSWSKIEKLSVQVGAQLVQGDIPVSLISNSFVAVLGGGDELIEIESSSLFKNINWLVIGLVAGGVLIIALVIFFIWRTPVKSKKK